MGLLQVGVGALSSVLADQWREYFYCPFMDVNVLVKKGENRKSNRSFNTKGSSNIISNGSIIAVNEGQCMIIVEQGAIVEVCAQAGEFVFDKSTEPSIFYGGLGEGVKKSFDTFMKRVTMGGDTGKDQRVYFFNTKDIIGNKYGTANPVPFRAVDEKIGLDMEISLRCHGEYSYKMVDPIAFYKNVCANVEDEYTRDQIDSQLKSEILTALQPAFGRIADMGIRYYQITTHTKELTEAVNAEISADWAEHYGLAIAKFNVSSVTAPEEQAEMIRELQRNAVFRDPGMGAAHMVGSTASAMQSAAKNTSTGPMMAFAGMNMANAAGGVGGVQGLYGMAQQQQMQQQQMQPQQMQQQQPATAVPGSGETSGWSCSCGASGNKGKFCMECGKPKPEDRVSWTCSCGTGGNKGKFCMECGKPKPAGIPQYKCDKCGWEPKDPTHPPKFCPECGDPFDDGDVVG